MLDNLSNLNGRELLLLYADVLEALRNRNVVRSANNPVGDYAEKLVCAGLDLAPSKKSNKGYDAHDPRTGDRYEVKARRQTVHNKPTRFSPLRDFDEGHFNFLIAVLFESDFSVRKAVKIPYRAIDDRISFYSNYQNGRVVYVRDALWTLPEATDVLDELHRAERVV